MSLNKIDFSNGIRPEEIQENFEMLQQQIDRERLSIGGYGVASGFDITPIVNENKFAIHVSGASIIDKTGGELFIPACEINIDLPELQTALEHRTINYNNTINISQIPYASSRRIPAEYLTNKDPRLSGIYINYPSNNYNTDDYIRVSDIKGNVLTVTGATSKEVVVRYNYTADRIDVVYLKNDNTVAVIKGTTSTTPSRPYMPADGKLLIAYLMIEHQYVDENMSTPSASLYVKEDMRSLRNLYTDENNNLYVCGTPFDELQIVHMKEPKNPTENTLWLNTAENTLYYWRSVDSFVYTDKIILDQDFVESDNANRTFATYMDFLLEQNELEIYHNGSRLIKDIHYNELYNELPTYNQNVPADAEGNSFRLIEDKTSGNGLVLRTGDEIMYMIRFKGSHYMWVPINKMTYLNAKHHRVYCTNDYMPNNKDGYFDSDIARGLGEYTSNNEVSSYEYKYQYFFFHREKDLDMLFTPNRNELSIHINQMVLHADQFEEITVHDLIASIRRYEEGENWVEYKDNDAYIPEDEGGHFPVSVARAAAIYFGWTREELDKFIDDYDNTGIGFKLAEPLDSGLNASSHSYESFDGSNDLYVEAIVEKRVCCSPIKRKLQRSATFVTENTVIADEDIIRTKIINLPDHVYYRYNESQLEVFINGNKLNGPAVLDKAPDYIEQFGYYLKASDKDIEEGKEDIIVNPIDGSKDGVTLDQGFFERKRSAVCNMFMIDRHINLGDTITYRIATNIYSYDHINNLLDDIDNRLSINIDTILNACENIKDYKDETNARLNDMETEVFNLNQKINNNDNNEYFDKAGILGIENMPNQVKNTMIVDTDHINIEFSYTGANSYSIGVPGDTYKNIRAHDYLTVVYRDLNGYDHFLIPFKDYTIEDRIEFNTWKGSVFNLIVRENNPWTYDMGTFYITGIKLGYGRAGR